MAEGPVVLAVGSIRPNLIESLRAAFDTAVLPSDPDGADALLGRVADRVRVVATASKTGIGEPLLDRLPALGAISNFGVGLDRFDLTDLAARGLMLSTTTGVLDGCVADVAVAMLLDLVRELPQADAFVRSGAWRQGQFPATQRVRGTRVGILGLGAIGRAVAARLEPFGVELAYHSRRDVPESGLPRLDSPLELARWSQVLVVAVAGTAETVGLVSDEVLDALGDGWLVNVARGSCVDQDALIRRLASGQLRGAGLDVYVGEPDVPAALSELSNVILLPHLGPVTRATHQEMCDLVVANIDRFLREGSLLTPVALPAPITR
ncbi:MAG: 2-hydroxyacid dehydrogenase [Nocardioides sp.]